MTGPVMRLVARVDTAEPWKALPWRRAGVNPVGAKAEAAAQSATKTS